MVGGHRSVAASSSSALAEWGALARRLSPHFGGGDVSAVSVRPLQSLWAGYGSLTELEVNAATPARGNGSGTQALVVKRVDAPAGSGVGHERKLRSYRNEMAFYQRLAAELNAEGIHVPEPLLVESEGTGKLLLVMKDQRQQFPRYSGNLSLEEAKAALVWLAAFHAFFWGRPTQTQLWEQGTFWHLDTRRSEFEDISWEELAEAADVVDQFLKGEGGAQDNQQHMTVVHGDFKQENLLFSADGHMCAAHDFQYCGRGLGAKDLAYLFCSGLSPRLLPAKEEELLRHYHSELTRRLQPRGLGEGYTFQVLLEHFEVALVDFVRFMDGWGYWGNNRWARQKVQQTLKSHPVCRRS